MSICHYVGIVHKDENSSCGIHFPDVPGCFSAADTLDELLPNAIEALTLHLEGEHAPDPRTKEDIESLEEVRGDLIKGAFLVEVPFSCQRQGKRDM